MLIWKMKIWDLITYPFEVLWLLLRVFGGAVVDWVRGWGFLQSVAQRAKVLEEENDAKMAVLRKRRRELMREAHATNEELKVMTKSARSLMEADLKKAIDEGNGAEEESIRRQLNMLSDMEHRQKLQTAWMNKKENS